MRIAAGPQPTLIFHSKHYNPKPPKMDNTTHHHLHETANPPNQSPSFLRRQESIPTNPRPQPSSPLPTTSHHSTP